MILTIGIKIAIGVTSVFGAIISYLVFKEYLMPKTVEEYIRWKHNKRPVDYTMNPNKWKNMTVNVIRELGTFAEWNNNLSTETKISKLDRKCQELLVIERNNPKYEKALENANKFCTF